MARRPPQILPRDERDETIRRLRDDLFIARTVLIGMLPAPVADVLNASLSCDTPDDVAEWLDWAVAQIIEVADPQPGHLMGDFPNTLRAYCPVCGRGANTPYSKGFSFPEGLHRHLHGTHRSRQCAVLGVVLNEARTRALHKQREGVPRVQYCEDCVPVWRRPAAVRPSAEILPLNQKPTDEPAD